MSRLLQLPVELIVKIVSLLDWKTLLACEQVCTGFRDLLTSSLDFKYTVELAVAGMEDGPPSTLLLADRLQRLREHQAAWRSLQWRTDTTIDMLNGGVWELYGGVLAQSRGRETLVFEQLPSEIKGIPGSRWELVPQGLKSIRDFAMEPAIDLLVLIESATAEGTYRIHLRSMTTGKAHPNACTNAVLSHTPQGLEFSFAISICGQYLGVLFICGDERESQVLVWNWQTGKLEIALKGYTIGSFAFLDDEHIVVGLVQHPEPSLQVVRFRDASEEMIDIEEEYFEYTCSLRWPTLRVWAVPLAMSIRSDPARGWHPRPDLKVPFHTSREDRVFVVTLWIAEGANIITLVLFVPCSTIISRVQASNELDREVRWDDWGPHGSRMMKAPTGHSMTWVCYVFGQSFIAPRRTSDYSAHPVGPKAIQILDFNQLAIKKDISEGHDVDHPVTTVVRGPTTLNLGTILERPVVTHLPYRVSIVRVPTHGEHTFNAVMLSEDSIVTVASNSNVRQYRVLSF